jgi:hypothetical protein
VALKVGFAEVRVPGTAVRAGGGGGLQPTLVKRLQQVPSCSVDTQATIIGGWKVTPPRPSLPVLWSTAPITLSTVWPQSIH